MSAAGPKFDQQEFARTWALRARIRTVFLFSGAHVARGTDVQGHPPRRIESGPRTSVPRPKSATKTRNIAQIRAPNAYLRGRFWLIGTQRPRRRRPAALPPRTRLSIPTGDACASMLGFAQPWDGPRTPRFTQTTFGKTDHFHTTPTLTRALRYCRYPPSRHPAP